MRELYLKQFDPHTTYEVTYTANPEREIGGDEIRKTRYFGNLEEAHEFGNSLQNDHCPVSIRKSILISERS